ncbi:hypothetical protein LTT66_02725 [Nocardia gipuzkoensis]|uniref:hypothetical protein n=1 Tax=Nocardia gipuzkoensis TaxID=2749991 RepID=UPI001E3AC79F|nr:hypothetical protein [Nocardia gipuzkoensis]UGT69144.1 hypothetical protein LTT66_02725 [Nocardia gipuzkoensis]
MMTLFVLGAVLWLSCFAAFLVGARFLTVGRSRTSAAVFLFTFPFSGLGALMMIPAVPRIDESSVVQNVLLIALLVLWAVFSLLCTSFYLHLFLLVADKSNARPFFSRRVS